jgi:hypothetical protein
MIRVILPTHLWRLANSGREISLAVDGQPTIASVLDVLEREYPMLRGTVRDHVTRQRRAFVRFFICGEDWSNEPLDRPLPEEIISGAEPFRIIGAMAGGSG